MAISDYRKRVEKNPLDREALRPRRGYLIVASLIGFSTLFSLLYRDILETWANAQFEYFFPFLLFIQIFLGLFCVACYRMPALGNRLLGYAVVLEKEGLETQAASFTKSFAAESAASEKRQASKRMTARQARRRYARQTKAKSEADQVDAPKADGS